MGEQSWGQSQTLCRPAVGRRGCGPFCSYFKRLWFGDSGDLAGVSAFCWSSAGPPKPGIAILIRAGFQKPPPT